MIRGGIVISGVGRSACSVKQRDKIVDVGKLVDGEALLLSYGGYQPPDFRGVGQDVVIGGRSDRRAEGQLRCAQAGVGKNRVQHGAEPRAESHGLEGAGDPRCYLPKQRHVRDAARPVMSFSENAITPPGRTKALSCRSVVDGSGKCIRINRPITASTGSSKVSESIAGLAEMHCGQALFGGAGA